MQVPFHLLDVFAESRFAGNQLCVVPEVPAGLDADSMLAIAGEIGFAETTFVTAIRDGGYDVRIFTPDAEIPFAGHPTVGTAFLLASRKLVPASVVQTSAAGDVQVEVDVESGRASMRQLPPAFGQPFGHRAAVAAAAGLGAGDLADELPIVPASTGLPTLIVPVRDEASLRRAVRGSQGCAEVCEAADTESLYLFAVRGDGDVMARMFDRLPSIGEDAATGSAAGPLGAYLSEHGLAGMPGRVVVAQGEMIGRPSFLAVDVAAAGESWTIDVGGGVQLMGEGVFEL